MIELLTVVLAIALVAFLLWALLRIDALAQQNRRIADRLDALESELRQVRGSTHGSPAAPTEAAPARPPRLPIAAETPPEVIVPPRATPGALARASGRRDDGRSVAAPPARGTTDWEQFMGVKLFAWLGGLAAFLGAAFFVKYSFEHNLIPPAVRVAIGYVFALALVVGGLAIPRKRYAITAETLIATGIVSLYAVTYACNSIYHFAWFGPAATFAVMTVITAAAFVLAVRLDARVVAVLGVLGGFMTPVLLGSVENRPVPLFAYIALLDVGLLAIAIRRAWTFLAPLATIGTAAMELLWTGRYFYAETVDTMLAVCLGFGVLFLGGYIAADQTTRTRTGATARVDDAFTGSAAGAAVMAFIVAIAFLALPRPGVGVSTLFEFAAIGTLVLLALQWFEARAPSRAGAANAWREWFPALALFGTAVVEYGWRAVQRGRIAAVAPLDGYVAVYVLFAAYPFLFWRRFAPLTVPWATAALVGAVQFPLVYRVVRDMWPNDVMGLLPFAFAVVPAASLAGVAALPAANERARLNQIAWFGAITVLFITLIFPIQFERQWVTLGWALEGAAVLWLFHRVPHAGLRAAGVGLLVAAFARLALNPTVLTYHPRSSTAVFNWYLYTYGIVIAALFAGARLTAPPRDHALGLRVPPLLHTLGTVLLFLLLNIEIADFFSVPGTPVLTFQFSGNFARDMTYTIAWALFALVLLLVSMARRSRAGRYAALALLGVTVLKLFLHDLARLDALYRIGALFAVAAIAIVASVAYQRYLPSEGGRRPQP